MQESLAILRIRFHALPKDMFRKIYSCQLKRMKAFKHLKLLENIHWIIEVKVCLTGEFIESFVKHMPGMEISFYSKKRRAK